MASNNGDSGGSRKGSSGGSGTRRRAAAPRSTASGTPRKTIDKKPEGKTEPKRTTPRAPRKTTRTAKKQGINWLVPLMFVALACLIITGILVITMTDITETTKKPTPSETVKLRPDATEISNRIKLLLFDYEITRNSITINHEQNDGGREELEVSVTLPNGHERQIRTDILKLLRKYDLKIAAGDVVSATSDNLLVRIELIKPAAYVVPETPVYPEPETPTIPKTDPITEMPKAEGGAKIAILLDDSGYDYELAKRVVQLETPISFAIIPHLQYTRQTADLARKNRLPVFLHFPMQPKSYPDTDPGKGAALLNMPEILLAGVVKQNMESIGKVDGFNNHMGSAFTESAPKMRQVLNLMKDYTQTFVDSNTSRESAAFSTCQELGLTCGLNKKFIDNTADVTYIQSKLVETAELANKLGTVIAIGHLRPATVDALEQSLARMKKKGYSFISIMKAVQ